MDRRDFLRIGGSAALALGLMGPDKLVSAAGTESKGGKRPDTLWVRFLGTGAADWNGPDLRGEWRRYSSVLLDGKILLDFTASSADMLPSGCRPREIFYTHSHSDHFDPAAALRLGIRRVYLGATWLERGRAAFQSAATELHCPVPEIIPLSVGERRLVGDIFLTALPANHATADQQEQALLYLVEKGRVRLLYATDTAGIPAVAARLAGIDAHRSGTPITALIMEATQEKDDDFRMFTHSSIATVQRTVQVLLQTDRYTPPPGQYVYLTHFARTLHGTQADLDRTLPHPLKAAFDGLDLQFCA